MSIVTRITKFFNQRVYLIYILVFVIVLSLFGYLQFNPTFADPDSFYHAKMAQFLRDKGAITEFPWLSATTLKYNYIDHHFLYHLLLIPFVTFFPPLIGLKIATIFLASLSIVTIFWFLRQLKVKGAFWFVLFLLTVEPFIFRLSLAKAQALVLILLFISFYFLLKRYYLAFLVVVFFYVWLYAGWPLVVVFTLLYLLISWTSLKKSKDWLVLKRLSHKWDWHNIQLLIALIGGISLGLFFSPYFAKNFYFYWQQSFKIAVINYQYLIGVGGEWYPYSLMELIAAAAPLFFLLAVALLFFIITYKKQSLDAWLFLVFSFVFFALTLKSRRNVEYFAPLAVCFSALSITNAVGLIKEKLKKLQVQKIAAVLLVVFCLSLTPIFYRDIKLAKDSLKAGFPFSRFAEPARWLKEHTPQGSIVFHSDWDEFPFLFYYNDWNYYIVGLDPTFMYEYDKDLHRRWVAITTGQSKENLRETIKTVFNASYVFVDTNSNMIFDRNLAQDLNFKLVFENQEVRIYQILNN